jgi:membrane fusion protein (multidrug efflux system)
MHALLRQCARGAPPSGADAGAIEDETMTPRHAIFRVALLTPLVAVAWISGCGRTPPGGPGGAGGAPGAVPVTVVTLAEQPVSLTRELPGRTAAFRVAEVRPQVSGIVERRLFEEGALVKAGQALYQLDDATYRADVGVAKAAVARAEAGLEAARLRADRSARLVKTGLVSAQENDNAVAALHQAEADLQSARAALDAAQVKLGRARITAPIGGRIGKSAVTEGALVTADQDTPLATIQQLDPMYVDLTQSSAELLALRREIAEGRLEQDGKVTVLIVLEDGSRYAEPGTLAFSDVTVEPTTGSYLLRIRVPNPRNALLPGMFVRAEVGSGVRPRGLLVPQQGIARDPRGNASAMVVDADGKAAVRPVKVSRAVGDRWLVDEGLAAGDRVIVEGLQKIQPGAPVQATEASPPSAPAKPGE